ncbi:hypothetical protein AB837_00072 [bacterium AB1]|nr:hypothetical protein AB837_00072 [bacterium AB1]
MVLKIEKFCQNNSPTTQNLLSLDNLPKNISKTSCKQVSKIMKKMHNKVVKGFWCQSVRTKRLHNFISDKNISKFYSTMGIDKTNKSVDNTLFFCDIDGTIKDLRGNNMSDLGEKIREIYTQHSDNSDFVIATGRKIVKDKNEQNDDVRVIDEAEISELAEYYKIKTSQVQGDYFKKEEGKTKQKCIRNLMLKKIEDALIKSAELGKNVVLIADDCILLCEEGTSGMRNYDGVLSIFNVCDNDPSVGNFFDDVIELVHNLVNQKNLNIAKDTVVMFLQTFPQGFDRKRTNVLLSTSTIGQILNQPLKTTQTEQEVLSKK